MHGLLLLFQASNTIAPGEESTLELENYWSLHKLA